MPPEPREWEAIVVGAGPAGLSAALLLGRSLRRTLVLDAGLPRNAAAPHAHGFLTRDGAPPLELLRLGRDQLRPYPTVTVEAARATDARPLDGGGFAVRTTRGEATGERLVIATGMEDLLPPVPGLAERWGHSVFHCPYCEGFERRGQPIAILAAGGSAVELATLLRQWSGDLAVFTDGKPLEREHQDRLERLGVPTHEGRIARLAGDGKALAAVELEGGQRVPRTALMLHPEQRQASDLPARLGCRMTKDGLVEVDAMQETSVRGAYAVGDCSRKMQHVVMAAADGATAALHINSGLLRRLD